MVALSCKRARRRVSCCGPCRRRWGRSPIHGNQSPASGDQGGRTGRLPPDAGPSAMIGPPPVLDPVLTEAGSPVRHRCVVPQGACAVGDVAIDGIGSPLVNSTGPQYEYDFKHFSALGDSSADAGVRHGSAAGIQQPGSSSGSIANVSYTGLLYGNSRQLLWHLGSS